MSGKTINGKTTAAAFIAGTPRANINMALMDLWGELKPGTSEDAWRRIYREWMVRHPFATTNHSKVAEEAESLGYQSLALALREHKAKKVVDVVRRRSSLAERVDEIEARLDRLVQRLGGDE